MEQRSQHFKQNLISILEYILVILLILDFNTPYTQLFGSVKVAVNNLGIIVLLLLIVLNGNLKINSLLLFLVVGAFVPLIGVKSEALWGLIKIFLIYIPLFFVFCSSTQHYSQYSLLYKFSNVLCLIAIVSLFFWFFGSILGIITSTFSVPYDWGGVKFIPSYYGIYFETQEAFATAESIKMTRNSGIFNEAPMFNMMLCIALGVELFLRKKKSWLRAILFVVTIFTTVATTGIIFVLFVLSYIVYSTANQKFKIFFVFVAPFIVVTSLFLARVVLDNKKQTGESSYNSRIRDIENCIELGMDNPFVGIGMDAESIAERTGSARMWGYSNSLFTIFARGGIYVLTLYAFCFFIIPIILYKYNKQLAIFILGYALVFSFTISYNRLLTLFMLSFCLSSYFYRYHLQKI